MSKKILTVPDLYGVERPLWTLDFETFYDPDNGYTLGKMTTVEYVRHELFKAHGVAVVDPSGFSFWVTHRDLNAFFSSVVWEDSAVLCHNTMFDMLIGSEHFNVRPAYYCDTMFMSLGDFGSGVGASHQALCERLGRPGKIAGALASTAGIRNLTCTQEGVLAEYGIDDAEKEYLNFRDMYFDRAFPPEEMHVIDLTLRGFCDPVLRVDAALCRMEIEEEEKKLQRLLLSDLVGAAELSDPCRQKLRDRGVEGIIASADCFAELLRSRGVAPPMKPSPSDPENKEIYAFAKNDLELIALGEDPRTSDLVAARIGVKSTLRKTRAETFLKVSDQGKAPLPIPLKYCGARTHRWSGTGGYNCLHPDVEVLSRSGWVRIEDWQPDMGIMQWWPDNTLSWDDNASKVEREEDDDLVWIDSPFVKGGFTKDHRFVAWGASSAKVDRSRTRERTAGWIAEHSGLDYIPVCGKTREPGTCKLSDDQIRFMVALAADGCDTRGAIVFGFRKERKIKRMEALLEKLGIQHSKYGPNKDRTVTFRVGKKARQPWMVKGYNTWVLSLRLSQLEVLIEELPNWDGGKHANQQQTIFTSCTKGQAEWVATAAHLAGRAATLKAYKHRTAGHTRWDVYFRMSDMTSIDTKRQVKCKPYSGTVYCPTVSSSYILTRYAGGISVLGQCQNLPSGRDGGGSRLREAIQAPKGWRLCIVDAAQIECVDSTSMVLTDKRGYVTIPNVELTDRLWDGIEWVEHGGVIFKGYREVIEYGGLRATPDHVVYLEGGGALSLAEAKARNATLLVGERGGEAVRVLDDFGQADSARREDSEGLRPVYDIVNAGPRHRFCVNGVIAANCRVNAWAWNEDKLLEAFATGGDPYSDLASAIYGVKVTKKNEHSHLRPIGKAAELSLGYGVGWKKFAHTVRAGMLGPAYDMPDEEALRAVGTYRNLRTRIVGGWDRLRDNMFKMMAQVDPFWDNIWEFHPDKIRMPNDLFMHYKNLHMGQNEETKRWEMMYQHNKNWTRIYPAKLCENLIQSTARTIVAQQAVEIAKEFRIVLLVHDEVVYLVPENHADEGLQFGLEVLRKSPSWCPDIPLDAEGEHAENYVK